MLVFLCLLLYFSLKDTAAVCRSLEDGFEGVREGWGWLVGWLVCGGRPTTTRVRPLDSSGLDLVPGLEQVLVPGLEQGLKVEGIAAAASAFARHLAAAAARAGVGEMCRRFGCHLFLLQGLLLCLLLLHRAWL